VIAVAGLAVDTAMASHVGRVCLHCVGKRD